jgi:hypothetical protein
MSLHDPLTLVCICSCIGVFGFALLAVVTLIRGRPGKP